MTIPFSMSKFVLASVALLGLTAVGRAADVKIENYSNDTVFVAQADNHGVVVSHGWTAIKSNGSKSFTAADSADLFIRIQDKDGKEITFNHHKTFRFFPTNADRFNVKTEADDSKVLVLKHGPQLQFTHNVKKGDPLPAGWSSARYFEIGSGSHKLEIKP